ncbi:MAG: carbonic anhydrase [Chryseolinea sp.]
MTFKEKILLESKAWALEKQSFDNQYFKDLTRRPKTAMLWIDSTDNLVPVRELTNTDPGEILVHRNHGSQVRADDISLMASLEHAVEISGAQFIVVCGYSHCSGVRDVIQGNDSKPHLNKWLEQLHEMYEHNSGKMERLSSRQKEKLLCELNIQRQIINLSKLDIVQSAWESGKKLTLLGWYFDLSKGSIQEIFAMEARDLLMQVSPVE